jgi:O-methyltransferase
MSDNVYQIIQSVLLAILAAYIVYYIYTLLFGKEYQPKLWKHYLKQKKIPPELQAAERKYKDKTRFFNFWFQVERLKKDVPGAFAELGVYKGDSAHVLHLMDPSREFHLFDTFEGFTEKDLTAETGKAATYTKHNFADTSIERVKEKLSSGKFVFHKGYFPDSASGLDNNIRFALVNMDADLYIPTKAGLEFFYPRLAPGGVIIIHDYNPDWPGIMKAVDEFAATIPEPIVPVTDSDSSVMIFKSK